MIRINYYECDCARCECTEEVENPYYVCKECREWCMDPSNMSGEENSFTGERNPKHIEVKEGGHIVIYEIDN